MTDDGGAERLDAVFGLARSGDRAAFAEWMGMLEIPLRRSLRRWARAVDVEVVVQETFLRMWLIARDPDRALEGNGASLKFAFRVSRNVALEEMRRWRSSRFVDLEALDSLPEGRVEIDPPDPALARAIRTCLAKLPAKQQAAIWARVREGRLPDRQLAEGLQMKLNTFLQNIVRARRLLRDCLEKRGVRLAEILP